MPVTARVKIPYPKENQDPWYEAFKAFTEGVDQGCYSPWEDRNFVIMGGGVISFDAGLAQLAWVAELELLSAVTGFLVRIDAATVTMNEGDILYIPVTRAPQGSPSVAASTTTKLPTTVDGNDYLVIAVRRSNRIYFRNGDVLQDGESLNIIETGGAGGGGGGGDVVGPAGATDEAIARYDGATGKIIQDSTNGPFVRNAGDLEVGQNISHVGNTTTRVEFTNDRIQIQTGGDVLVDANTTAAQDYLSLGDVGGASDVDVAINTDRVFVEGSSGNVGVHTPTPQRTVDIVDEDPILRLKDFVSSEDLELSINATTASVTPSEGIEFRPGAGAFTHAMLATGEVGIGTAAPVGTLHVNGSVCVKHTRVTFGMTPYSVAADDYILSVMSGGGAITVDLPAAAAAHADAELLN